MILAKMEELAPTPKEVICADARKDGQALIVTKMYPYPAYPKHVLLENAQKEWIATHVNVVQDIQERDAMWI